MGQILQATFWANRLAQTRCRSLLAVLHKGDCKKRSVVGFHRHGRTLNGDGGDQNEPFVDVDEAGDVGPSRI